MVCVSPMQGALSLLEELDTEVSQKEVEDKAKHLQDLKKIEGIHLNKFRWFQIFFIFIPIWGYNPI